MSYPQLSDHSSLAQSAGPSPTFICPNPSCRQEFLDLDSHLSDPHTPCERWALANLEVTLQDLDDEAAQEDDELPSLISAAQGAEGDEDNLPRAPAPAPLPQTTNDIPPQVSILGLRKVLHSNRSMPSGPRKLNTLQQIDTLDPHAASRNSTDNVFYPFSSHRDWQLGKRLTESSLSQNQINTFLRLDRIRSDPPSFSSATVLRDRIERLPAVPEWFSTEISMTGYRTKEPMILYYRDGIRVLENLFANPVFATSMEYTPYQLLDDDNLPVIGEFMSARFAHEYQSNRPQGSTLVGVILTSDKTPLTVGTGNKEMHPVLLSCANIPAGIRMKATSHAFASLAYLPIPKFLNVKPEVQATLSTRVYHACFDIFTSSLKRAERAGHFMPDGDGTVRFCFTPLVSHIMDMAEQRQAAIVLSNQSPTSTASHAQFGDATQCPPRTRQATLDLIAQACRRAAPSDVEGYTREAGRLGLLSVHEPYWRDWGQAEPSLFLTPDALHAWHKFFFDHVMDWVTNIIGGDELDRRLQALPISVGVRHWTNGVSKLKQLTGREHRELEKLIVAVIAGAVGTEVLCSIRAIVEFFFNAQALLLYDDHMHAIDQALLEFHHYKNDIIRAGGRRGKNGPILHFKIPKLEGFGRVTYNAEYMGTPYQYTSDITERCHITHVKQPYRQSNRRNFVEQVARFMDRLEKVSQFDLYTCLKRHGVSLLNVMVEEASDVADHYPEATWLSHVLPRDEHHVTGAASRPSLFQKVRSRLSEDMSTAFLVTRKPHRPSLWIVNASQEFKIPELRDALVDHFDTTTARSASRERRQNVSYQLPFSHMHIWNNLRIQQRSSQDSRILLPVRTLQALPPSTALPYGRCNTVLITDNISGSPTRDSDGQRYSVAQVRMIFAPVLDNQHGPPPTLCYAELFEFSREPEHRLDVDPEVAITAPHIDMFVVKRRYRDDGRRVADIIPVADIREIVELVPIFGKKIADEINCDNSLELDEFYLNHFANKESFHSILSYQ